MRLVGHGGPVRGITVAADGRSALTASFDYSIILWTFADDEASVAARLVGHRAAVNDVAFVPGGQRAVSASDDGTVGIWDLESGTLQKRLEGHDAKVLEVAVSPDGRFAVSAGWDHTARLWNLETMQEMHVLRGHRGNVNSVAFSADGQTVFTGSYDGTIRAWNVQSGRVDRVVYSHGWGVNVVRVLPNGGAVLFGALDGSVGVVERESGEMRLLVKYSGPVLSAAVWAGHGLAATGGGDGTIRIWRLDDWEAVHVHENAYGPIWALDLSGDGTTVFYAGLDDFVIGWTISPREQFEPVASVFPRRFQLTDEMSAGEREFARKCSICHTLGPDGKNRAGPTLYRLFGRRAGSVEGYPYSPGLANSDIIWTEETVGQLFDIGPDKLTPGSKMPLQRLKSVEKRDELIAFLKAATAPREQDIMEEKEANRNPDSTGTGEDQ